MKSNRMKIYDLSQIGGDDMKIGERCKRDGERQLHQLSRISGQRFLAQVELEKGVWTTELLDHRIVRQISGQWMKSVGQYLHRLNLYVNRIIGSMTH